MHLSVLTASIWTGEFLPESSYVYAMILLVYLKPNDRDAVGENPTQAGWSGRGLGTDAFQTVSVQFNSIDVLISPFPGESLMFDIMTWHIVTRCRKHQRCDVFGLSGELPSHVQLWLPNVDVFDQGTVVRLSGMMTRSSSLVIQQEGTHACSRKLAPTYLLFPGAAL